MELIHPLLLLLLTADPESPLALPDRNPPRLAVVLPSPAPFSSGTFELPPLGLVLARRSLSVANEIVDALCRGRGRFVVGPQPRLLERFAVTAAGCNVLVVPVSIGEETHVYCTAHPLRF